MPRRELNALKGQARTRPILLVYDLVFLLLGVVYAPIFLYRALTDARWRQATSGRLGFVPRTAPESRAVWIHGVSVGEVKGLSSLVATIAERQPDLDLVVSTTTQTGQALAREKYAAHRVIQYPLDFVTCPGRALDRIRPVCIVLMELEIWPRFIQSAARRGIPVVVVSGRISESSFRGYRRVRWALPQFGWISHYCVQNETYQRRLVDLDIEADSVTVTGNLKYDNLLDDGAEVGDASLRSWLASDGRSVLVCGSTHGREDEWLAQSAARVSASLGRPIRTVVAPRHPDRVPSVVDALTAAGFGARRWSACREGLPELAESDVVVVDTIGHLESFYEACDVAFVGGSLVPHGGQNMLEPASLGRAVAFGPHTENFRSEVEGLLAAEGAVRVASLEDLDSVLGRLFSESEYRQALGERAIELIRENQGAVERTYERLSPYLSATSEPSVSRRT